MYWLLDMCLSGNRKFQALALLLLGIVKIRYAVSPTQLNLL